MKIAATAVAMLAATPGFAETRPMPDYFVSALVATSAAQSLALSCASLSVNPVAVVQASDKLLEQLEADGFDVNDPASQMDSGAEELNAAQTAFMEKHALDGANEETVCAAGRAEIAEGSAIGTLLLEESQ